MSKDDYYVIAYRLLTYLYACLKKGKFADPPVLSAAYFEIGVPYFGYIVHNLHADGYISGVDVIATRAEAKAVRIAADINITPKGILYLSETPIFQKAKDIAAIIPV